MAIWLELRVTMGTAFKTEDEHEVAMIIEEAIDRPARHVYFQSEENFSWTYVRMDEARIPAGRIRYYQSELRRAFRDVAGRSLDEVNIVDEDEVAHHINIYGYD